MNLIPNIIFIAKEDRQSTVLSRVSPTPAASDTSIPQLLPPPEEERHLPTHKKQQHLHFDIRIEGNHEQKTIKATPPLSYAEEPSPVKPLPLKDKEPRGHDTHKIGDLRHQVDIATRMVLKIVSFTPAPETDESEDSPHKDTKKTSLDDNPMTPSPQTELIQSSRHISSKPISLNEK